MHMLLMIKTSVKIGLSKCQKPSNHAFTFLCILNTMQCTCRNYFTFSIWIKKFMHKPIIETTFVDHIHLEQAKLFPSQHKRK
jgi:hypothetical protein